MGQDFVTLGNRVNAAAPPGDRILGRDHERNDQLSGRRLSVWGIPLSLGRRTGRSLGA
jgi:hypothetical protein